MLQGLTAKILVGIVSGAGMMIIIRRLLKRTVPAMCLNKNNLAGKTVIITGANTGIGKEVARELAKRDSRVIMACRDVVKGEKAAESIKQELKEDSQANVIVKKLNLASLKSVQEFTDDINSSEPKVDILINNAGVFGPPFALTEDGVETTFATNHLGHFLLTNLLLKKLESSMPAKIIVVSSKLYENAKINFENLNSEQGYKSVASYAQSKLANLLFAYELNKRLPDGVTVNSLHPGFVATELPRHVVNNFFKRLLFPLFAFLFMRTVSQGAQTVIYLATAAEVEGISGKYFGDCKIEELKEHAMDNETAKKLWQVSEQLCGLE